MLISLLFLFLANFAACSPAVWVPKRSPQEYLAPLEGMEISEAFPNEYVVIFHNDYTLEQHFKSIGRNLSNSVNFERYSYGYSAKLDDETRDNYVRRDPGVRMVETNRPVHLITPVESVDIENPDSLLSTTRLSKRGYTEVNSTGSPYGLQMLTTGSSRLDIPVQNDGAYDYLYGAGQGVQVYILDTGIRITHKLFEGRARNFGGLASTDKSPYVDETMEDIQGHGTHVAGIVGAEKYGVAPFTSLINVKVLGNGSSAPNVGEAIRAIIREHNENKNKNGNGFWTFRGSIINMSLGWQGDPYAILYALIDANDAGISIFAAAGNKNTDARNHYPCANVQTRCIAAVDNTYNKARFSNYGEVVNFIAPGEAILSLGIASDTAIVMKSGTSMASPYAAGTAAIFSSWQGLVTNYDLAQNFVYWNSISGVVSGFPSGTTDYFVTTGIHSPKKYPNEPFRWAGDWPVRNHIVLNASVPANTINPTIDTPSSLPLSDFATSQYTAMSISSFGPISGLTTEPGDVTYDPIITVTPGANPIWGDVHATPTAIPTLSAPACTGNQIEGSCTQAHLPSATPDSGILYPVCNKVGDGIYRLFNNTQALGGVYTYCSELHSGNIVISSSNTSPKPGYVANAAEENGYLAITVEFDVDSCDAGTTPESQRLDFGTLTVDECYQKLYTVIAESCAEDSTWSDFNPDYSLQGGVYGDSCALWSLQGLPGSPPLGTFDMATIIGLGGALVPP